MSEYLANSLKLMSRNLQTPPQFSLFYHWPLGGAVNWLYAATKVNQREKGFSLNLVISKLF